MPAKMNSEFNYRYQVIGETVWAKIKTLKGFLEGRENALAMQAVSKLKHESLLARLQHLKDTNAPKWEIMSMEADIMEAEALHRTEFEAFELNRQEIAMLQNLLQEYYEIAEPTRIPGFTDEQMFEANAANEFTAMIGKEIYAEIVATGRASPAKIRNAMSNPLTWYALKSAGLIPAGAMMLEGSNDPRNVSLKSIPFTMEELDQLKMIAEQEGKVVSGPADLVKNEPIKMPKMPKQRKPSIKPTIPKAASNDKIKIIAKKVVAKNVTTSRAKK